MGANWLSVEADVFLVGRFCGLPVTLRTPKEKNMLCYLITNSLFNISFSLL